MVARSHETLHDAQVQLESYKKLQRAVEKFRNRTSRMAWNTWVDYVHQVNDEEETKFERDDVQAVRAKVLRHAAKAALVAWKAVYGVARKDKDKAEA